MIVTADVCATGSAEHPTTHRYTGQVRTAEGYWVTVVVDSAAVRGWLTHAPKLSDPRLVTKSVNERLSNVNMREN